MKLDGLEIRPNVVALELHLDISCPILGTVLPKFSVNQVDLIAHLPMRQVATHEAWLQNNLQILSHLLSLLFL
jgi:hypothetical protein